LIRGASFTLTTILLSIERGVEQKQQRNIVKKLKTILLVIVGFLCLFAAGMLGFFMLAGLDTARGAFIDPQKAADGVYIGHYRSGPNRAEVEVTITSGKITDIKVIRNVASWIGKAASDEIPRRIIAEQSTRVDSVTGATRSSVVIMNAVNQAVKDSYQKKEVITD
jgi:uncharacterized protein with FMN-binding domain